MTDRGETITMLDDHGLPHDFTLVDVVEVGGRRYAVLQPDDPAAGAVVFRVEDEMMMAVDDADEFGRVVDALRELEEYDDLIIEDGTDEHTGGADGGGDEDEEAGGP